MKVPFVLLLTGLCLAACTSISPLDDHGGGSPLHAADGSPSPFSQSQALAVARVTVAEHEGWPEHEIDSHGLVHIVYYGSHRIDQGGWRFVAHRAVMENRQGGAIGYDHIPAVIMIINSRGVVTHYVRKVTDE